MKFFTLLLIYVIAAHAQEISVDDNFQKRNAIGLSSERKVKSGPIWKQAQQVHFVAKFSGEKLKRIPIDLKEEDKYFVYEGKHSDGSTRLVIDIIKNKTNEVQTALLPQNVKEFYIVEEGNDSQKAYQVLLGAKKIKMKKLRNNTLKELLLTFSTNEEVGAQASKGSYLCQSLRCVTPLRKSDGVEVVQDVKEVSQESQLMTKLLNEGVLTSKDLREVKAQERKKRREQKKNFRNIDENQVSLKGKNNKVEFFELHYIEGTEVKALDVLDAKELPYFYAFLNDEDRFEVEFQHQQTNQEQKSIRAIFADSVNEIALSKIYKNGKRDIFLLQNKDGVVDVKEFIDSKEDAITLMGGESKNIASMRKANTCEEQPYLFDCLFQFEGNETSFSEEKKIESETSRGISSEDKELVQRLQEGDESLKGRDRRRAKKLNRQASREQKKLFKSNKREDSFFGQKVNQGLSSLSVHYLEDGAVKKLVSIDQAEGEGGLRDIPYYLVNTNEENRFLFEMQLRDNALNKRSRLGLFSSKVKKFAVVESYPNTKKDVIVFSMNKKGPEYQKIQDAKDSVESILLSEQGRGPASINSWSDLIKSYPFFAPFFN